MLHTLPRRLWGVPQGDVPALDTEPSLPYSLVSKSSLFLFMLPLGHQRSPRQLYRLMFKVILQLKRRTHDASICCRSG
jgi:hypothetical protein